jgi:dihydropteroate synthase-like protein
MGKTAAAEHILFLTGHLAKARLAKVLAALPSPGFTFEVADIGVKVAALMTGEIIRRRLRGPIRADRVLLPGRFSGDVGALSDHYGCLFQRGPDDLKDLGEFFGRKGPPPDLSRHEARIFAEIVDAPRLGVAAILARAALYRSDGADVIDLGCLPDTPFPHLEESIAALIEAGHEVSVDSADIGELRRGARAGAGYLLSLTEKTLALAEEVAAIPVLIPARHGDLKSLLRAMEALDRRGRPYLADPVLDPIHFGFMRSLGRYAELRRRRPEASILMGTGNLTELTDADSTGVSALLMGIVSELAIANVLVVQVSPHCRRAVAETDRARRMMFAAREAASLPVGISPALLCLHDRRPFPDTPAEIAEMAAMVGDDNFRIAAAEDGIHVFNRRGSWQARDPFQLFPHLGVEGDGSHAFYLGVECARAEIAWRLGKRYVQDRPLDWGVAAELETPPASKTATRGRRKKAP